MCANVWVVFGVCWVRLSRQMWCGGKPRSLRGGSLDPPRCQEQPGPVGVGAARLHTIHTHTGTLRATFCARIRPPVAVRRIMRVRISARAVLRRAVRMTLFLANVRPGAPKLSPSSPDTSGERVHHARLNAHCESLHRRCSSALGACRALKRPRVNIFRCKNTLAT
jgi:hypothetical protein